MLRVLRPPRRSLPLGPLALVAAAVAFGLVELRAEAMPVAWLNDMAFHSEMVRFAGQRLAAGHDPLTSWFPLINSGSPVYLHYQALPSILTGAIGLAIGPLHAFSWSNYLLLATWPVSVYLGARMFGLSPWAAAASAAVSPLLTSVPGVGYEWGSYLWVGWGVWTQLWAMWVIPMAWGATFQAISRRRLIGAAIVLDALTVSFHYLTGYLVAVPIVALPFVVVGSRRFFAWAARAVIVGAGALLASSWVVVPVFMSREWAARNEYLSNTSSATSFGARAILTWLFDGQLFDKGRPPVVTALVLIGLLGCLFVARRHAPARALVVVFVAALVLFFGKPTLGPLVDLVPGHADLFWRRFLAGVELCGIFLAGVGASLLARALALLAAAGWRLATRPKAAPAGQLSAARRGRNWLPATLRLIVVVAGVVALAPAWTQRAAYAGLDARDIAYQQSVDATSGAQLNRLLAIVRRRGGGRVYAGTLSTTFGQRFVVGYVPLYAYLADEGIDAIGFSLRSASLMSDAEPHFEDSSPADYSIFAVRYLLLPSGQTPPVPARRLASAGSYSLFSVATTLAGTGYLQVVDTQGSITERRTDVSVQSARFVDSSQAARGAYPTVAWAGGRAPAPTLAPGADPTSPPGRIVSEQLALDSGRAAATVVASRPAVVLLKESFDPGWHVSVDGRPAATEMLAPARVGVRIPAGRHRVVFFYEGYSWYPELFALAGTTIACALVLPPVRRRRRRRRTPPAAADAAGDGSGAAVSPG